MEYATLTSKELRLGGELELLSAAMTARSATNSRLNEVQTSEREAIIADFKDVVTARHREDQGKTPEELKSARLGRLHHVLDPVIKKEGKGQKFDPYLYDWLIKSVKLHLGEAESSALKNEYADWLGPR